MFHKLVVFMITYTDVVHTWQVGNAFMLSWNLTFFPILYLHARCEQVLFLETSVCVCVSVRMKSPKLLVRNRCNLVQICPTMNARNVWKLVTFDVDLWPRELFSYFFSLLCSVRSSGCLNIATSFLAWRCIFRISRSLSSFKVVGLMSRSQLTKAKKRPRASLRHSLICFNFCSFFHTLISWKNFGQLLLYNSWQFYHC